MIGSFPHEVKDYLFYNKESGVITWIKRPHSKSRIKIGDVAGGLTDGYIAIRFRGKLYYAHRLAFFLCNEHVPDLIDHKDTNTTNNKWDNIRPASVRQNAYNQNLSSANKSGFKGVCLESRSGKWLAQVDKKRLGYFTDPESAAKALSDYRKKNHKDFANNG